MKYLCTQDGGQFNIPVEIEFRSWGLCLVRGLTSDLVGWVGSDGHCYTLCHTNELFDEEQAGDSHDTNNVIPLR